MSSKNSKSPAKPKKLKSKRAHGKNVTKTKVVVRRLPPLIPESLFFDSVKQWVNEETCTWSRFHQGRISKSKNKESIFSRAYFHFKTVEQVLEFHRGYDNHLFIDKQGNENRAVVEFAVYQKLPREHKRPDPRQGTIETDPDYLAFLESLKMEEIQQATAKEPSAVLESGATQLERLEARLANAVINATNVVKPTTTPLLEHLRALKLGPKSKSPPLKHAQIAILSPSSLSAKGTGSRAAKQSSQARATQANEFPQSTNRSKRERKRRERVKEERREKEKREKDKEKDKKDEEENNKDIEKIKVKESEVIGEKLKEKTKEQVKEKESYREKRRDKKQERERQKLIREREKKAQATEAIKSEPPTITIVPRPQTEELKAEAKEKEKEKEKDKDKEREKEREKEKEKEIKRAPVKITIQQRQKEQIRQFIQKTSSSPKKEINTAENDSKETANQESIAKDSTVTVQKDARKEENKDTSPITLPSSNAPSNENRYRRRERSRKHSTDTKTPVQIQILTKPQTQSTNTSESNVSTSTSSAAISSSSSAATTSNAASPVRRTGRGYFGKRGGRW